MRHTISILVENEFGVLSRISGLFSGRGFNIENLSVNETLDPTVSRITLQTTGDDAILEQITKQLNKLVSVIKVVDMSEAEHVERELALIKVAADARTRGEVFSIANVFRAKVVDVAPKECIIEVTGDDDKIGAILTVLKPIGIKEIARTGKTALFRGERLLTVSGGHRADSRNQKSKKKEKAA
ncbi:MAG: acetolactate synthase small subunit [Candidatus Dadabacteria bacterium]|nr:MAG: acetolactate synthase small subunit [Candidatus Dadabacteria bacterium]